MWRNRVLKKGSGSDAQGFESPNYGNRLTASPTGRAGLVAALVVRLTPVVCQ